ncbi:MAG: phage major capsid protein [Corynebacteriales bacterium]|nr:phage major capsid protein [Mycobacteriales bacterium]
MASTTSGFGPILTPAQVTDLVIKPLVAQSVAGQILSTINSGTNTTRIPRVLTDPSASWVAEGAEISATDATVDELDIVPAKLAALSVISSELANDSTPAAANIIGQGLVRDLQRKMDAALFATTPITNGPQYSLGTLSGVSTVSAGAAYTNADAFSDAKYISAANNGLIDHYVTNPATAMALSKLKETASSNRPLLQPDVSQPGVTTILGTPLMTSPSVPTALGTVWAVPSTAAYLIIRDGATLDTDSSVFFTSDRIALRCKLRAGFAFPLPAAVVKITTTS